jgi:HEAT repeat protein
MKHACGLPFGTMSWFWLLAGILVIGCDRAMPPASEPPEPLPLSEPMRALQTTYQSADTQTAKRELVYEISELGTEEAVVCLSDLLAGESVVALKMAMVDALSEIPGSNAVAAVASGLVSSQPTAVRLAAIEALDFRDDPAALPYLRPLLTDPLGDVRKAASDAIDSIERPPLTTAQRERLRQALQRNRKSVAPPPSAEGADVAAPSGE